MNLDPKLGRIDRIGSLALGAGLVGYAILGGFDQSWLRVLVAILGLVFAVGGLGGT